MRKLLSFIVISFTLLFGLFTVIPSVSNAEEVTEQFITKEEAVSTVGKYVKTVSEHTYPNWKGASYSIGKTLYSSEGKISAYVFQIRKADQDVGYIIINGKKNESPIIESARKGTNPFEDVEEGNAIYNGPLKYFKKENGKIVTLGPDPKQEKKIFKPIQIEDNATIEQQEKNNSSMKPKKLLASNINTKKLANVPDYIWFRGCTPTATTNLLGYWYLKGYENLMPNIYPWDTIEEIAKYYGTKVDYSQPDYGSTYVDKIAPGLKKYFNDKGYRAEVELHMGSSFQGIKNEIDQGRPMLITTYKHPTYGDHSVTGIGYEDFYSPEFNENFRSLIVHDTWETTPEDMYIDLSRESEFIHSYATVAPKIFEDVPATHWAHKEILYMYHHKIASGYGNGYFGAGDNITREQLAGFLYNYLKPEDSNENPFNDINDSMFKKQILALTKKGVFSVNSEHTFNPKGVATRAEAATIIVRAFNLKVKANYEFNDMKGHWANEYVKALYSNGIANGVGDRNFNPGGLVTRDQFSMFLYRAIHVNPNFVPSPI
ncbi:MULTISPECIES: S-layer homology domain-containing protein [Bacillus cereus group]|uniref:S-layer homology domain-containing protein n=1 Tax=Bacillus cereus group TaxID=86661 RepID=UPI001F585867|nr:S-layer homology domain-containing protein [Bacillus thuringiensis]MDA2087543.1 S-layer homology domain-containing protein [Bacillus cereus]MDD9277150.1 S-layer homology domain-containing protein [Bacillus thuringiensis]